MLEALASDRFSAEAREKVGRNLRRAREKVAILKRRYHTTRRKIALLQQVGGHVETPSLEHEIDRLLSNHYKLTTDWGRRFHLLTLSDTLYGTEEAAPEHLQDVVKAEVSVGAGGYEAATTVSQISPRRMVSELLARTVDGTEREPNSKAEAALSGEYGRSLQAYALLAGALEQALTKDPFGSNR